MLAFPCTRHHDLGTINARVRSELARTLALAQRAAKTDATILITGESGVGKSALARHIHETSLRKDGPFIQLNAATLPEALVESELFGAKKGAFTDARHDRDGVFQQASGGTLFLDEIAELSLAIQPKLLSALETRRVRAVGSPAEVEVDLRLIAATNQDLEQAVAHGEFREDLFYRLNVFPIEMPPLRARVEDVPALVRRFTKLLETEQRGSLRIADDAMACLKRYRWPGNVRELANVVERAAIVSRGDKLQVDIRPAASPAVRSVATLMTEADVEQIRTANTIACLRETGGKVSGPGGAAELLGMRPTTLYSRIRKLGLHAEDWN